MLDFRELSEDGNDLELLVRELLHQNGKEVYWSGKGPDGGKDLICIEKYGGEFKDTTKRWLIQCKHNAHAGRAVNASDVGSIVDSCAEHNATGYVLVCTTYPSSALVKRLEEIEKNNGISTCFWDAKKLEQELLKPSNWNILNIFFPSYTSTCNWNINMVEPGLWFASYNGNLFYISTRITADYSICLKDIENLIEQIKGLDLGESLLRLRALYFDDKTTNYKIYLNLLVPEKEFLKEQLEAKYATITDSLSIFGIYCEKDIEVSKCNFMSDSFDPDDKRYYRHIGNYRYGEDVDDPLLCYDNKDSSRSQSETIINGIYERYLDQIKRVSFLEILSSSNAQVEKIDLFQEKFSWPIIIQENFFYVKTRFFCEEFDKLTELLAYFPQNVCEHFELQRNYPYFPGEGFREEKIYTLVITIITDAITNKQQFRSLLNHYLADITSSIERYLSENPDQIKDK